MDPPMDELSEEFNRWVGSGPTTMPLDVSLDDLVAAWRESFRGLSSPQAHLAALCEGLSEREALFGKTDPSLYGQIILLVYVKTKSLLSVEQRKRLWGETQACVIDPGIFDAPARGERLYGELFPDDYARWRAQ